MKKVKELVTLPPGLWPKVAIDLFEHFRKSDLQHGDAKLFLETQNISHENKKSFIDNLSSFSFFEPEKYEFDETLNEMEKIEIICCLAILQNAVENTITGHKPLKFETKGLTRQVSPPLEAYEYHNIHNELDIIHSKGSYAYLFDR